MDLQFQLTENDYADAQLAHIRKSLERVHRLPALIFGFILALGMIVSISKLIQKPAQMEQSLAPMGIAIFVTVVIVWIFFIRSGFVYRRQFRKIKALQGPIRMEVTDEQVVSASANGEGKILWSGFEDWRESKNSFLLYIQPRMFYIVPKRAMQIDQIPGFRAMLEGRIRKSR